MPTFGICSLSISCFCYVFLSMLDPSSFFFQLNFMVLVDYYHPTCSHRHLNHSILDLEWKQLLPLHFHNLKDHRCHLMFARNHFVQFPKQLCRSKFCFSQSTPVLRILKTYPLLRNGNFQLISCCRGH